jgi:hypothetical protein
MIFLSVASSVGNFDATQPAREQAHLAGTRFQVEPLAVVLSFPRKRESRFRQNLDARFRGA